MDRPPRAAGLAANEPLEEGEVGGPCPRCGREIPEANSMEWFDELGWRRALGRPIATDGSPPTCDMCWMLPGASPGPLPTPPGTNGRLFYGPARMRDGLTAAGDMVGLYGGDGIFALGCGYMMWFDTDPTHQLALQTLPNGAWCEFQESNGGWELLHEMPDGRAFRIPVTPRAKDDAPLPRFADVKHAYLILRVLKGKDMPVIEAARALAAAGITVKKVGRD